MCGLAGWIDGARGESDESLRVRAEAMAEALAHRGPDGDGVWVDAAAGVALAHRRLSIIDLRDVAAQPMTSADGRLVLSFNGEIYNFERLRAELEAAGTRFRSRSDTEVLLEGFGVWGVRRTLEKADGMFALALWDRTGRTLTLARDRFGEKPLYYTLANGRLLFGSELGALRAHPDCPRAVDRGALALYLRHSHVPAPHTIYTGVKKLPPASLLTITTAGGLALAAPQPYWSAKATAERAFVEPFTGPPEEAITELERRLLASIRTRMIADVPLGAFLSGGIDSTTIVALMQTLTSRPVKTYTMGFHDPTVDEAVHARAVAKHLGTDHAEHYVTPEEALAIIPDLPRIYDEPFADASQLPTTLLCRMTRGHVKVALSGDAGDELFGGYPRYHLTAQLWRGSAALPMPLRRFSGAMLGRLPSGPLNRLSRELPFALPFVRAGTLGDKIARLAEFLALPSEEEVYQHVCSHWTNAESVVRDAPALDYALSDPAAWAAIPDPHLRMMAMDAGTYLPDQILTKVDRASMSCALEVRAPLLQPDVAALAWSLDPAPPGRAGSKWPMRGVLTRHVPAALIDRPKKGFVVPLDAWLRGPLRAWAGDLLGEDRLRREGYFDPRPILAKWDEHQRGAANWHCDLWDVLMFEAWLAAQ